MLLCVSELVTNALLHGVLPGRLVLLFLRYDGRVLRVEVHDSGGGVPRITAWRGLLLVAALSDASQKALPYATACADRVCVARGVTSGAGDAHAVGRRLFSALRRAVPCSARDRTQKIQDSNGILTRICHSGSWGSRTHFREPVTDR